jgi:DNA-binding NtrC family response regulator
MKKIIVVDDEQILHLIYKQMVKHAMLQKLELVSIYNLSDALVYFSTFKSQKNIVLLDINLGNNETGWQLLESGLLEKINPLPSVFVCTSSNSLADKIQAFKYPIVKGFYQKPLSVIDIETIANH